ncbi:MAG TPA: hypothetical protein VLG11_02790 [Candidatus Saccharimonadales bacterium]|nr:hypothetical protein [Candidatus Saccharimonadales bacterium]
MSEQSHAIGDPQHLEAVIAQTREFLDESGKVDYYKFDAETMQDLWYGPGPVENLVEQVTTIDQQPDIIDEEDNVGEVIVTSAERFVNDWNNFAMRFVDSDFGTMYRDNEYYERFRILFPDLEQTARREITAYRERRNASGTAFYHEEPAARFSKFVFGVLRQLVDKDDRNVVQYPNNARHMLTA